MKKINCSPFLCFLFLLFLVEIKVGFTQTDIDISAPSKLTSKASRFKIIGKNQDGYIVQLYGSIDILQSFGNDLRLIATKTIDFKNQTGLLQHIEMNKSGVTAFYLSNEKKATALMAQPLSNRFVESGNGVFIDSIFDRPDYASSNLRVTKSLNREYTLFYYPYFKGEKIDRIQFICLDNALNKIYTKTLPLNRPDNEIETAKFTVDNDGNAYAVFLKSKEKMTMAEQEIFTVYKVSAEEEAIYETEIKIKKNLFGDYYFNADNSNHNIVLSGFYDDDNPRNEPAAFGFFFVLLNTDSGTLNTLKYNDFEPHFMQELTSRQNQAPKLFTFNINRVILRHDGGAALITESLIKDSRETVFNSQFSPTFNSIQRINFYQYNDIVVFSLKPDGSQDWHAIMRKKQSSEEDNGIYSSFLISNERDKLRFLYIDEISTAASLREYVLNSNGKVSGKAILNQENEDLMLLPQAGKQVSPNEIVLPSYLRNQLRLVKITY